MSKLTRRAVMASAPAVAIAGTATAQPPDVAALVEAVMQRAVPGGNADYQQVKARDLQALCEALGVEWASHWGLRGRA